MPIRVGGIIFIRFRSQPVLIGCMTMMMFASIFCQAAGAFWKSSLAAQKRETLKKVKSLSSMSEIVVKFSKRNVSRILTARASWMSNTVACKVERL